MSADARRSDLLAALRRYLVLVLLATLLGGAAATALSYRSGAEYTGTATYLVPPGKLPNGLTVTPFDAERLGRTYAVVVANDRPLLERLAEDLGRTADEVAERTTTTSLANSAAIRVQYRGDDRPEVRRYFDVLSEELESSSPASRNVEPGSVRLLRVEDEIPQSGGGSWVAGLVGALCGLLVGGAAASYLHGANPRVRGARDLRDERGPVVLDVDPARPATVEALAHRVLTGAPPAAEVAVVGATAGAQRHVRALAESLGAAGFGQTSGTRWSGAAFGEGAERLSQRAARTVLVVAQGERPDVVSARLSELRDLGVNEVVLAVVSGSAALPAAAAPADPGVRAPAS